MDEKLTIRKAVLSDAPIISRITRLAFTEYAKFVPSPPEALTETVENIENDIESKLVITAEIGRDVVGCLRLTKKENKMYLSRFAVRPVQQSSGIGTQLMEYAILMAKLHDCEILYLHTACDAEHLMSFYSSCGFEIAETNEDRGYRRATLELKIS